jgi:putative hemolysin
MAVILFFTTAQIAIRHVSRAQLSDRLEKKGKSHLVERMSFYRDDLIFCCSVVRIGAILALVLVVARFFGIEPVRSPFVQYPATFAAAAVLLVITAVTLPNIWAQYGGKRFLIWTLPLLLALRYVMYPLIALQKLAEIILRRLAGLPSDYDRQAETDQFEQDILEAVTEGELVGAVHEDDADMIESVIRFRSTDVAEIMTPRTEVVALPATTSLSETKQTIVEEGHTRIPIFEETLDDIKGVLYAKDLLNITDPESFRPADIMRKVPFVPETKPIPDLLAELREKKVHLAIVVDEYGGTAGLVTIEDIIEEIVGEIVDEYEPAEPEPMRQIDKNTFELDARVHISQLNSELSIELPEDKEYDTIGGLLFSQMGKIPAAGEQIQCRNVRLRVLDAEDRKVNRVHLEVLPEEETP